MEEGKKIIGTFVPVSALGQGTFEDGLDFLDWLKKTNQTAWQFLPLHQTQLEPGSKQKRVPSPYKSYGIGLDPKYISSAFSGNLPTQAEKEKFIDLHKDWIKDYAFFCALSDHFKTDDWRKWDKKLRDRDKETLENWSEKHKEKIDYCIIEQWQVHKSYSLLRKKAKDLKIFLIGDLPFYVSVNSSLVWANQNIFQIEKDGDLRYVSGIPNTLLAHFGRQVWGHPLYNWSIKSNRQKIIKFWKIRLKYLSLLFDYIRFDHAKAFFEYGFIDLKDKAADVYKTGPGEKVFEELIKFSYKNNLKIFAEDSGEKLQKLREYLQVLKIPGIKIFRFALEERKDRININYADIKNYSVNTVCYTTTHDTETLLGYLKLLTAKQKEQLANDSSVPYLKDDKEFAKNLRQAIINSAAHMVIIPIQDWLLTTDRINIPGTETPTNDQNWKYKLDVPVQDLPILF